MHSPLPWSIKDGSLRDANGVRLTIAGKYTTDETDRDNLGLICWSVNNFDKMLKDLRAINKELEFSIPSEINKHINAAFQIANKYVNH